MDVLQRETTAWSNPWEHRSHTYKGQVCNTLMAGPWDDRTPLHDAALQGRLLPLRRLLAQDETTVLLHLLFIWPFLIEAGELVRELEWGKGYCVSMPTLDGITPLHDACLGGHFTCAKLLLDHGANPNAVSVDGVTPLFSACCGGDPTLVSLILMHSSVHHPAHLQNSPIHEAAKRGHTACVRLLLSHGVNVNIEVPGVGTPLYCACETRSTDCVQSLLMSGAHVQCGWGLDTPLHAAARVGGVKEVELLLEHGADRTSRNSEGKKPLDLTTDQSIKHLLQAADPCSLSQMCRWCIRRSLGQKRLHKTKMLFLPHSLHSYLLYH